LLQLWDVSRDKEKKPLWQARNLPNDELDLQIPIFDTDLCYLSANNLVAVTAFGDVREYDIRGQRRPVIASTLKQPAGSEKQYLSKVLNSKLSPHTVYVAS